MHIHHFLAFNICLFITDKDKLLFFEYITIYICKYVGVLSKNWITRDNTGIDRQGGLELVAMGTWEGVPGGKDQIFPTRLLSLRGQAKHRISKHQVYNPTTTWQLLTSDNFQITSKTKTPFWSRA
jgi:hypothetical protein